MTGEVRGIKHKDNIRDRMTEATAIEEKNDTVIHWDSDPDNAKNWSTAKKLYNTAVPAVLCFLMYVRSPNCILNY